MSAIPKTARLVRGQRRRQDGSTDRNDSGSASMMPTSTSPTIRPPTGPRRSPSSSDLRLLEHVEPERRLLLPAGAARPICSARQRLDAELARDRLAGRQPDRLAALQVAVGERRVGRALVLAA